MDSKDNDDLEFSMEERLRREKEDFVLNKLHSNIADAEDKYGAAKKELDAAKREFWERQKEVAERRYSYIAQQRRKRTKEAKSGSSMVNVVTHDSCNNGSNTRCAAPVMNCAETDGTPSFVKVEISNETKSSEHPGSEAEKECSEGRSIDAKPHKLLVSEDHDDGYVIVIDEDQDSKDKALSGDKRKKEISAIAPDKKVKVEISDAGEFVNVNSV